MIPLNIKEKLHMALRESNFCSRRAGVSLGVCPRANLYLCSVVSSILGTKDFSSLDNTRAQENPVAQG